MSLPVTFSPEAKTHIDEIEEYIHQQSSSASVAARYVNRLVRACQTIGLSPQVGTRRDYLRPGARTIGFERRATILFHVQQDRVVILAIAYAGRQLTPGTGS